MPPCFEGMIAARSPDAPVAASRDTSISASASESAASPRRPLEKPSEDDLATLRRVPDAIPAAAYTIAISEICERSGFYGSATLFTNFVQWPLPPGSKTGAGLHSGQSGALGMGQKISTGLSLARQFVAYTMPLLGGYIADAHLGRFKTILLALVLSALAHTVLVVAASPAIVVQPKYALAILVVGLVPWCTGTAFMKTNIGPFLAEQSPHIQMRVEVRKGERVVVDPAVTNSRIFLWLYFAVNIGGIVGLTVAVWVEKYRGFWLAFLLPVFAFCISFLVLLVNRQRYALSPPTGSVVSKLSSIIRYAMEGKWTLNLARLRRDFCWDAVRPSKAAQRPAWMTYDDAWIDEVRRGLQAGKVFLFLPLYYLAAHQRVHNLTSQAALTRLHGLPNDLIHGLSPITVITLVPLVDSLVYPGLRRLGVRFTPIKRISIGFVFASLAMAAAAVTQHYIYETSPCGDHAARPDCHGRASIHVGAALAPFVLLGIAEIFVSATANEYAFSKAPENMRSLVAAFHLLAQALASVLGQVLTPLSEDPYLVINFSVVAMLALVGGICFWFCFRDLDRKEDEWNTIARSAYIGRRTGADVEVAQTFEPRK